jgi:hypothetical protein
VTGLIGGTGIQGVTGLIGGTGIQGVTGLVGGTGIQGLTGLALGSTGIQGVTGLIGGTGIQGVTGLQGGTGIQGVTGLIGGTGIQGVTGFQGNTGIQGAARTTSEASSATPTPDCDSCDIYCVTALAAATATFGAPTGTPVNGQKLIIRVTDNGTARILAWNAKYRAGTDLPLPLTTVLSKTMYLGFVYSTQSTGFWDIVAMVDNI